MMIFEVYRIAESLENRSMENAEERRNDPVSMYLSVSGLVDEWTRIDEVLRNSSYDGKKMFSKSLKNATTEMSFF